MLSERTRGYVLGAIAAASYGLNPLFALPLYGAGLGILACMFPYLLYTRGLTGVAASHASVMATVEPVVATIIGVAVFGDVMTAGKCSGIVLILAGIVILNVSLPKQSEKL